MPQPTPRSRSLTFNRMTSVAITQYFPPPRLDSPTRQFSISIFRTRRLELSRRYPLVFRRPKILIQPFRLSQATAMTPSSRTIRLIFPASLQGTDPSHGPELCVLMQALG